MDCAFNDDKDWQPADGEDGSSSCFEDEECSLEDEECSEGRLSKVATTRKRVQLSAGPMSAILQEQPQPQVQAKRVRCQAAPMSATLQPSPTISQDQHENQSVQLQAQPQVQAKRVRCRAAPMSHVNERALELESHQQSMSSHTPPNLQSLEQSNEGSRTSVGVDMFHLFKRRLNEGASQIPESSESPTLREELFTSVLKPDRNGRVRTYGLGPCLSQVFGTRYTRSQEQRVKDQLRAELGAELRAEVLRDVSDEITQLKNQYATVAAYMKSVGHPLPPSPNGAGNGDGDHTLSLMEHNGQDRDSNKQIGAGRRVGDLYLLEHLHLPIKPSSTAASSFCLDHKSSPFYIWHSRLGHLSSERLKLLVQAGHLGHISVSDISECSGSKEDLIYIDPFPMDMDVPPEEYTSTLTVSDISTAPSASPRHAPITQVYTRRPTSTAAPQSASTDPDPPVRRYPLRDNRQPPVRNHVTVVALEMGLRPLTEPQCFERDQEHARSSSNIESDPEASLRNIARWE
ncbi:hypothetical protein RHGRI_011389 [Rhododendron griersonianum]|uniref:GAG-pre-integrase domain-containing protein n=1 Tax=Rhododendron griersonianum TaxID=479676 RepID=A0AAV6KML0_9ERIC|nr:hypothetical protein RHGRI_011389 [Rhododendron griersonianum]